MTHTEGVPRWMVTLIAVAVCLLPLLLLSVQLSTGQMGPDPAKRLMQGTGEWGLRGLVLVLLAAPLAKRRLANAVSIPSSSGSLSLCLCQPSPVAVCSGLRGVEPDLACRGT